eukprot:TRINITY_DN179_c0_g1_i1.p1 TRINITY_DN179_c0_g1~~TRINITY_DN179_c0_g1_i1.p1  ORF type:complete len:218 (+),score=5.27 TRINITY_DN179_c0_g1_i1:1178-1831(+)
MIKRLLLVLFLFMSLSGSAQKKKATLYFRNGDVVEGLAKIKADHSIKFRKDKSSKASTYTSQEIKGITIREIYKIKYRVIIKDNTYYYKRGERNGKLGDLKLFRLCVEGKLNLFGEVHIKGARVGPMGSMMLSGPNPGLRMPIFDFRMKPYNYYVCRGESDTLSFLTSKQVGKGESFKVNALKYCKDCPEVLNKIEGDAYKEMDVESIVKEYNQMFE